MKKRSSYAAWDACPRPRHPDDIRALAVPVLRHRILVNDRAEAEGVTVENIVERLLAARG